MGSVLLGLGISHMYPCAMTLPAEAGVTITPNLMMVLNLFGSVGEMAGPAALGVFFSRSWYASLGEWVALLSALGLGTTAVAFVATHSRASF